MSTFLKDLKSVYNLDVPKDVTNEWLKARLLKRVYVCHACHSDVDLWHVKHVEEVFGKKFLCPKCAKIFSGTLTEDAYPIPIN